MHAIAPLPPSPVSAAPSPGAETTALPPVLDLLIASRPDRERRSVALAVAGAIAWHALLLLVLLMAGPMGGDWRPHLPVAGSPEEPTISILWPGLDVGGAGRASAPAPAAEGATEAPLVTPRHIPRSIPGLPQPGAPGARAGQGAGGAGQGAGTGAATGNGPMSAADRIRPHSWDRRLWETPDELAPTQSEDDRVAARVQGKIDALNDSAFAAEQARKSGRDWTFKDKNGKVWGISPDGQVHLGGITLPLLNNYRMLFTAPPGRRDEFEKEQANWEEIQRSATQAEIHHTFDERVKAIRERKEKEHKEQEQKKKDTT